MLIQWIMAPSLKGSCCLWPLTISLTALLFQGVHSQMVIVNDTVSGYIGTDVTLHCSFISSVEVKITQVTWQKLTNGSKQNVATYHPSMGVSILPPFKDRVVFQNPSIRDGTIRMNRLQLGDEGSYICEFSTFPAGNRESQLNLTVLAKPVNQMEETKQLIAIPKSKEKVVVATCMSANGKPPSKMTWETKLKGEAEFQEIKNDNGTVTVISRYKLVPTHEAHKQSLTCVINYEAERFTKNITLDVQYEPQVSIEGFDGNWYVKRADVKLTCRGDANPVPFSYQWRMTNGSLPESAEVNNNSLYFRGPVTYGISGTYICEARNSIGSQTGQVDVYVTDKPLPQGLSGSLLGIIGVAIAVVLLITAAGSTYLFRRKKQKKNRSDTDSDMVDLPPSHKPAPPPKNKTEMKTHLTVQDIQVVHLDPVKAEEEIITLPIQAPYYDMSASDSAPYCEQRSFGEHCPEVPEARNFLNTCSSHEEDYLEHLHPGYVPLSFFMQDSHPQQAPESTFCYPPAGSRAPYVCPKEQYV